VRGWRRAVEQQSSRAAENPPLIPHLAEGDELNISAQKIPLS